jgi:hypothetical protein
MRGFFPFDKLRVRMTTRRVGWQQKGWNDNKREVMVKRKTG